MPSEAFPTIRAVAGRSMQEERWPQQGEPSVCSALPAPVHRPAHGVEAISGTVREEGAFYWVSKGSGKTQLSPLPNGAEGRNPTSPPAGFLWLELAEELLSGDHLARH